MLSYKLCVNIVQTLFRVKENQEMTSINVVDEDERSLLFNHKPGCLRSNTLAVCTCDDVPYAAYDSSEHRPLISYQNQSEGADARYLTDIHCHEAKPIYSNARARRKLLIASVVCLFFVIAEVVGKYSKLSLHKSLHKRRSFIHDLKVFFGPLSCANTAL